MLSLLQDNLGETAVGRRGSQYVLDEEYYKRIEAMRYVLAHDDGQATEGLQDADVVLVGVSRASKTPTAFSIWPIGGSRPPAGRWWRGSPRRATCWR